MSRRGASQGATSVPVPNEDAAEIGSLDIGSIPDADTWARAVRSAAESPFSNVSPSTLETVSQARYTSPLYCIIAYS